MNKLLFRRVIAVVLLVALVFAPDILAGDKNFTGIFVRVLTILAIFALVFYVELKFRRIHFPLQGALLFIVLATLFVLRSDLWAWFLVIIWFGALIYLARRTIPVCKKYLFTPVWLLFAVVAGVLPILFYALSINFSEEEFFIAVSGAFLALFWLITAMIYQLAFSRPPTGFVLRGKVVLISALTVTVLVVLSSFGLLKRYQRSFYPADAPSYPGISDDSPFLCAEIPSFPQILPAQQTKTDYLALLEASPHKNTLIWGSLAHYTGDPSYAVQFRLSLLQDAAQARYTAPAHSVKWGQYEAALRAHQLALISLDFPDLFSAADRKTLNAWFAAVNRRAMTTEWVDWLYAAAYGKPPQGPYENQEIGAGLLAVLTQNNLAASELDEQNQAYLNTVPLGWRQIFRNTDDSYSYQGVWLPNAWWIYNYRQSGDSVRQNIERSFQWLLLQVLPDGQTLTYNINGEPPSLDAYLFGASLLNNPQLSWLAGKNAQKLRRDGKYSGGGFTIPDFSLPDGQPPTTGSCLLYGNSGVPTRKGVLAPDKIVLRDGWEDDALTVLLNLRFTGWHRYKASNTLPLLYSNGALISERGAAENFWWLPVGRSAFRDKRIPREYLNGLLLPKSGLSDVVWRLTGVGSKWAQNPPTYAQVDVFFTGDSVDAAQTTLTNWNGWRHTRTSYLIHKGLFVVIDHAETDRATKPASVVWHLKGSGVREENALRLDNEHRPAKITWLADTDTQIALTPLPTNNSVLRSPNWELLYTSPEENRLDFAVAFLTGERVNGEIALQRVKKSQGVSVDYADEQTQIHLLHNNSGVYLQDDTLGTDGIAALLLQGQERRRVCVVKGQCISARFDEPPQQILIEAGEPLAVKNWHFEDGQLEVNLNEVVSQCFEVQ